MLNKRIPTIKQMGITMRGKLKLSCPITTNGKNVSAINWRNVPSCCFIGLLLFLKYQRKNRSLALLLTMSPVGFLMEKNSYFKSSMVSSMVPRSNVFPFLTLVVNPVLLPAFIYPFFSCQTRNSCFPAGTRSITKEPSSFVIAL